MLRIRSAAALAALIAIAAANAGPASAGSVPAGQPLRTAGLCLVRPATLLPMPDGATYALILRSDGKSSGDVHLQLFSNKAVYAVTLGEVRFYPYSLVRSTPQARAALPAGQYESAPRFVVLPRGDALIAAQVDSATSSCAPAYNYTDDFRAQLDTKYVPSPARAASVVLVRHIFDRGVSPIAATEVRQQTLACRDAFSLAGVVKSAAAAIPVSTYAQPKSSADVAVTLDPLGYVVRAAIARTSGNEVRDLDALDAARSSTYRPAIFRCAAQPSTLVLTVPLGSPVVVNGRSNQFGPLFSDLHGTNGPNNSSLDNRGDPLPYPPNHHPGTSD
jgi:hypothetical protein